MTRHSRKLTGTATQKLQPFHLKFNSTSGQTHWRHASNTSLFTGVICHLCINKETIGSKHRKLIRDVRRRQDVKRYIQKKANMDEGAFSEIDWNSHEQTVRSFQSGTRIFLVKFLHRWLPVGKHVSRYDPTKYRGNCHSCDEPVEDFHHFLSCPDPERKEWQSTLRTKIRERCKYPKTDAALLDLLLYGFNQ